MPAQPPTTNGKLSDVARHVVVPAKLASTGWPSVRDKCRELGIRFDPWQDGAGRIILSKRLDGSYATSVGGVVISIPRQVGKTFLLGALVFALCLLTPGMTVIWTAHRVRTAAETFSFMQGLARRRKIAAHVDKVVLGSGDEAVEFRNGSRILFGARERGFGRGFAVVDVLVFDEAQILTENAIDDMVPATNQAPNPLLLFTGTPPKTTDPGEVFSAKRAKALSGTSDDMAYIEFSADENADLDDREQWAKANPSYPRRTPAQSILRMRENLTDDSFMREALGVWESVKSRGVIPSPSWMDQVDETSIPTDRFALGVECGPDLAWASIALSGQRADNDWHIELHEDQHTRGRGVTWLIPLVEDILAKNPQIRATVVDVAGPIATLLEQKRQRWFFKDSSVEVHPVKVSELGQGCALVLNGIVTGALHHIGQPQLSAAALAAGKRALGDTGMWVWSRKTADSDITPIQAATLALIGAQAEKPVRPRRPTKRRREGVVL